ncbi:hypothetical protein Dsin_002155 [Dipteronia sinensis]|uniref:Nuclease HARBI1 n=1 Tax=Dipteronia sinensis TaxID=43782 RepID=A0AAE0EJE9_9ROSI|nr:hypothetical protein Dsin_002155 [Dipteronia sinensis]
MNFNIEGPSNFASSSFHDDEAQLMADLETIDAEQEAIITQHGKIQPAIAQYLNQQNNQVTYGGSIPGHIVINRDRKSADSSLFNDYFVKNPRYNDQMFRRCFQMGRSLFLCIVNDVEAHDNYFVQRRDSVGRLGLSTLQKITTVFRMLAYGLPANATDEYIKIEESIAIESLKRFCRAVMEVFAEQYLISPNAINVARILRTGKDCGFPGMMRSLDCTHWKWKNRPTAWARQYVGRSGSQTIILEAVGDYDLWIWHAYFGLPGTNNDINMLDASYLFANLA